MVNYLIYLECAIVSIHRSDIIFNNQNIYVFLFARTYSLSLLTDIVKTGNLTVSFVRVYHAFPLSLLS